MVFYVWKLSLFTTIRCKLTTLEDQSLTHDSNEDCSWVFWKLCIYFELNEVNKMEDFSVNILSFFNWIFKQTWNSCQLEYSWGFPSTEYSSQLEYSWGFPSFNHHPHYKIHRYQYCLFGNFCNFFEGLMVFFTHVRDSNF